MLKQTLICQNILRQQPLFHQQIKSVAPLISAAPFSRAQEFLARSQAKYREHAQAFRERAEKMERDNKPAARRPFPKGYSHPYQSEHNPLNFSPVKNAELFHDFVGPEQVSPHYENFLMSRKYAMIFWAGLLTLSLGVGTLDLHWIAKSSFFPFVFWFQLMYFFLEWRKSLFKPLLARFYRRVAANDLYNFEVFYHENVELKVRELMNLSKSQLAYWDLHSQFMDVKADSVNNFLANEYQNLQRHINDRAHEVLKQAKAMEEINRNRILSNIVEGATAEIDKQLEGPNKDEIQRKMFESALTVFPRDTWTTATIPSFLWSLTTSRETWKNTPTFLPKNKASLSPSVKLNYNLLEMLIRELDKTSWNTNLRVSTAPSRLTSKLKRCSLTGVNKIKELLRVFSDGLKKIYIYRYLFYALKGLYTGSLQVTIYI